MKVVLKDMTVEGTPEEVTKFLSLRDGSILSNATTIDKARIIGRGQVIQSTQRSNINAV